MFTRTQNSASLICLLSTMYNVPKRFDALSDFHRFKVSPYLQILLFGIKKYGNVKKYTRNRQKAVLNVLKLKMSSVFLLWKKHEEHKSWEA